MVSFADNNKKKHENIYFFNTVWFWYVATSNSWNVSLYYSSFHSLLGTWHRLMKALRSILKGLVRVREGDIWGQPRYCISADYSYEVFVEKTMTTWLNKPHHSCRRCGMGPCWISWYCGAVLPSVKETEGGDFHTTTPTEGSQSQNSCVRSYVHINATFNTEPLIYMAVCVALWLPLEQRWGWWGCGGKRNLSRTSWEWWEGQYEPATLTDTRTGLTRSGATQPSISTTESTWKNKHSSKT